MVKSDVKAPVVGKKADTILAAYKAAQAALRLIKPGNYNNQVTEIIQRVADSYEVNPVEEYFPMKSKSISLMEIKSSSTKKLLTKGWKTKNSLSMTSSF